MKFQDAFLQIVEPILIHLLIGLMVEINGYAIFARLLIIQKIIISIN
jgi:hypothetical protein